MAVIRKGNHRIILKMWPYFFHLQLFEPYYFRQMLEYKGEDSTAWCILHSATSLDYKTSSSIHLHKGERWLCFGRQAHQHWLHPFDREAKRFQDEPAMHKGKVHPGVSLTQLQGRNLPMGGVGMQSYPAKPDKFQIKGVPMISARPSVLSKHFEGWHPLIVVENWGKLPLKPIHVLQQVRDRRLFLTCLISRHLKQLAKGKFISGTSSFFVEFNWN